MENRLGLHHKTSLINCHHKTQGFYGLCKSTVNIDFKRLQPKRKIKKIQQGTNNEGRRKEAIIRQTKITDYAQHISR